MEPVFSLDLSRLNFQMTRLALAAGKEFAPKIVREEAKQFVKTIVFLSPPRLQGQGENAVRRDISRSVYALTMQNIKKLFDTATPKFKNQMNKFVQGGDWRGVLAMFKQTPKMSRWFPVSGMNIKALHNASQTSRGRVRGQHKRFTLDIGEYANYVGKIVRNVGYLKGGWNAAARALGVNVPEFVARHGTHAGTITNLDYFDGSSITMTNSAVKLPDYRHVVDSAMAYRAQAMATKTAALLSFRAVNLGFAVVGGHSWNSPSTNGSFTTGISTI